MTVSLQNKLEIYSVLETNLGLQTKDLHPFREHNSFQVEASCFN